MPLYLAGILLGPVGGGLVGVVADLVGVLVNPMGAYFPGYTLSSLLTGLIPGLIAHRTDRRGNLVWPGGWLIFAAILVTNVIVSLGLNPIWLAMTSGKAWKLFVVTRFVAQAVQIPVFAILTALLTKLFINLRHRSGR